MRYFLCDIDGTVANLDHRLDFIKTRPRNYDAFFAAVKHDQPIIPTIRIVEALIAQGYECVFVSGRPEKTRKDTVAWLERNIDDVCINEKQLYMRAYNDFRADDVVKQELFEKILLDRGGKKPYFVIDDRKRVIEMWRKQGVFVLDVNQSGKEY